MIVRKKVFFLISDSEKESYPKFTATNSSNKE